MKFIINEIEYNLIENYKEGYDKEELETKLTEYFQDYDYIVGDWAYGKLRLKGFCKKENSLFKGINNFEKVKEYIKNNCAYDCKYFIIEKINRV